MSIDFCFQKQPQPQQPQQSNLSFQQQSAKMSQAQSTSNVSNIQQQNHHHRHFGLMNMEGSQSSSNLNHHQPQQQQQIESSSSPTSSINENFSRDSDTPPVIRWSRNFHNLIEDVDGVKLFSQYLDESNLLDMLNFWFACQGLKHQAGQPSTGTRDKIGRVVNAIFKKFIIKSNSIHLSDQMRQELIKQYTKSRQQQSNDLLANPNIFDQAQQDIERLLSGAIYDNFLRSDHYMHYFSLVVYPNNNNNNNNDDNNSTNNDENGSQPPQAQQSSNSNKILLEPSASATNNSRSNDELQNEPNDYHYNEGYSPKNYAEYLPTLNEELGEEEILEEEEEPEQEQQVESSTTQLEQTFDSTAANASGQLMLDNSAIADDSIENHHHQDQSDESPNDCCCPDEVPKNCSEEIAEKMSQISLQQQQQPQQRSLSRNTESINRSLTKSSSAQVKNQQQPNGYQQNQHSNPSSSSNIPSSHHQQQPQHQSVYPPAILSSGTVAPPFCDLSSLSNSTIVKTASVPTKSQLLTNNNSKKSNNYPTHNPRMFQSYLNSIKYENPPHPYHVMYNTVQPNSTRDSEIQSISSHSTGDSFSRISGNSRGDSDKFGKKGSSGGHSHSHQLRQHQQQLRTLNLNHSLLANSFGPGVGGFNQPRSQPRQSAIDPSTNIEAFAKDLIERLEKVRSNQEADSKLQNLLSSAYGRESPATGSMMNTSSLREAGVGQQSEISNKSTLTSSQNATNQPIVKSSLKEVLKKPVDFNFISENDQSILDKHCAQVFKTPNSGTPTGASVSATGVPLPVPGGGVVVPNSAYLLDSNHNNQSLRFYCSNDLVNNNNNGPSQYLQYDSRSTQSTLPPPSPGYGPNSNSNFSFNQTPSGRSSQQQNQQHSNNSANLVIVTVKFHNDDCPYKLTMAGPNITLASFKMQIPPKRGHQRYYFKRKCTELEMMESDFGNCQFIKEEITDENAILPQYDGKIFAMVEPKFANTYNNNNNHE